jgi:hypothetical protein
MKTPVGESWRGFFICSIVTVVVDANILFAEDQRWSVLCAFILIGTNPRVFERPLTMNQAIARIL